MDRRPLLDPPTTSMDHGSTTIVQIMDFLTLFQRFGKRISAPTLLPAKDRLGHHRKYHLQAKQEGHVPPLSIIAHKDPFPDLATVRTMVTTEEMRLRSKQPILSTSTTSSSPQVLLATSQPRIQDNRNNRDRDACNENKTEICRNFGRGSGKSNWTWILDFRTRQILLRCDSTGDLYPVTSPSYPQAFLVGQQTWHQRLGHPGSEVLVRCF
ncbi:hypothetical protein Tco_1058793 [Tanacetum coccineum]|uniref:Uncharacterized protein n=1 Tax=Tanacetum coccineum TaxID=301880 RepID=A0ABQ5H9A2_9ASTR